LTVATRAAILAAVTRRSESAKVVRLTDERLRRLQRRLDSLEREQLGRDERIDQAVDVLTRLVRVVSAQNDRVNRNFARLSARIDQLSRALVMRRTAELRRSNPPRRRDPLERRLT